MMELVQHHVKYKEIHGMDEIVWMDRGKHRKLHDRLRREGKCTIPPKELASISTRACRRTEKCHETREVYRRNNIHQFHFLTPLAPNVRYHEEWRYNIKTGVFSISPYFEGRNGTRLCVISEVVR